MLICPTHPWVLVPKDDPTLRLPKPCGSYRCVCCRPAKVQERVRVTAWALSRVDIVRMVTLTQLPEDWQKARSQVRDLARRLRAKYRVEWAWAIEANPRGTGYHAHAMQWGDYVPQDHLQRLWGGRITHIMRVAKDAGGYVTKCAMVAGYMTKSIADHLALNGGRAIHTTRGFLHGLTSREVLQVMATDREWAIAPATATEMEDLTPRKCEEVDEATSEVYTVYASTKPEMSFDGYTPRLTPENGACYTQSEE